MRLIFKYVGQGDSILLHWEASGQNNFVVIDANEFAGEVPTLDYIKSFPNPVVKAIILSHPHTDHFSGMLRLLNGLTDDGIPIGYFLHTAQHSEAYLSTAVKGHDATGTLHNIFRKAKMLRDTGTTELGILDGGTPTRTLNLTEQVRLTVLAPTSREQEKFLAKTNLHPSFTGTNNPNANYLSTVLRLEVEDRYYLLTSDCEKFTLKGLDQRNVINENTQHLVAAQIPHHGSFTNYNATFWRKRFAEGDQPKAIISVGPNHYGHPSPEVTGGLRSTGYEILTTQTLRKPAGKKTKTALNLLNTFSTEPLTSIDDGRDIILEL